MAARVLEKLSIRTFRANPRFQLAYLHDQTVEEFPPLRDVQRDPKAFALLIPRGSDRPAYKSICQSTAELFGALQSPAPIPERFRQVPSEALDRSLAELVLDEVLEVMDGGGFVSGAAAASVVLCNDRPTETESILTRLSLAAIKYAATLPLADADLLSVRLYLYNRVPASAYWRRRFPNEEAVQRALRLGPNDDHGSALAKHYGVVAPPPSRHLGWFIWALRDHSHPKPRRAAYKLYLSPRPAHVAEAMGAVVTAVKTGACLKLKIGS